MQNEEKQNFDDAPKTVWLDKYQIPVYTDLKRADEILYATDTQLLKRPKTNYFALADLGAPAQDIAKKSLSGIPFSALSAAAPVGGAGILLAKTQFGRGIYKSGIDMVRQAAAGTLKDAGTAAAAFGQDVDTRLKRDAQIDRDLAQMPASIRWQEKFMQNYKAAFSMLGPVDITRVNERLEAWNSEQAKIDEFNGKVKTVVDLFTKRAGLDKTEKDGFWYDFGSGAGSFLFSVGALAITRNPALVALIFGIIEGQGSYEQAVEAGVEPAKAYGLGKTNAAWITATEMVGEGLLNKLLFTKGVMGRAAQRILKRAKGKAPTSQITLAGAIGAAQGTAIEGTQEAVQSVGSNVILNLGGTQKKEVQEIALEALYEGLIGGLLGAFGGAAGGSANYARYAQNVKERFTQIGVPEETAQRLAHEVALEAVSSELTDDAVAAVSGEINSPLTAQDRDPQAFKRALTDAQKREIDKNAWAVGERVEQQALAAGVTSEEAAASGRVAQALANGIYRLAKLTPTEQEHFKISILNGSDQMEGTPAFAQAAAMYRNKAENLEQFYNYALSAQTNDKSYHAFDVNGVEVRIPADTVKHDENNHKNTLQDWKNIQRALGGGIINAVLSGKPRFDGTPILLKLKIDGQFYGTAIELQGKYTLITTGFKGTEKGIDAWLKKEQTSNAPYPFIFDSRLPSLEKDGGELVGKSAMYSLTDIIQKIKGETYNQGPRELADFDDTAPADAFVLSRTGHIAHGIISPELAAAAGIAPGEIRVYNSLKKHLETVKSGEKVSRLEQLYSLGYDNIIDFIDNVMANLSSIQLGSNNSLLLTGLLNGKYNNTVAIRLEAENGYYKVTTVIAQRKKSNKKTVWEAALPLRDEPGHPALVGPNGTISIAPKEGNFKGETYNQDTITVKHSAAMYRNPEFKAWFGKSKEVEAALAKIASGSEEETVPGLRPDFVKYGGTPDVTFIWGNEKKGLQHIALEHGPEILPQVIDTAVSGEIVRFTAAKKTLTLRKGNIEAVLSLDENGKQKTWLLTGWDTTSEKGKKKRTGANGQVSTGSAATQTPPTFSRRDLGAVLGNSITKNNDIFKGETYKQNQQEQTALMLDSGSMPGMTAEGRKLKNELPTNAPIVAYIQTKKYDFFGTLKEIKTKLVQWYKDNLQGTSAVNPELGDVAFTRAGISEVKGKALTQKRAYLLTAAKSVIEKGTVVGERAAEGHTKGIKKFHFVQGKVELDGVPVIMQVDIAEDAFGKKFYYVSEIQSTEGLAHDQNTGSLGDTNSITKNNDIFKGETYKQSQQAQTALMLDSGSMPGMTAEGTDGAQFPTVDDYKQPTRDYTLPSISADTAAQLGVENKPILLKKNIIEKNKTHHRDINVDEYNAILQRGLYSPSIILQTNPKEKPNYYNFIYEGKDKSDNVVVELSEEKKHFEIVSFYVLDSKRLTKKIERTNRNGGQSVKTQMRGPSPIRTPSVSSTYSITKNNDIFKGETYKQNIRGNVTIDEAAHEAIIRIFKDADPSTIVHELAHVYLSMIQRAATVSADAEFAAFMDDLNAWLGEPQEENGAYSRQQQEMFASGFEAYLAEGKAPNKELESVFEKFAKWLAEVYESVKDYLQITPQVRSIFDRLLAPAEPVLRSKVGDKLEAAKQLVEQMKKGRGLEIEGLGLADIKDLLKTLSVRKPAAPKTDLLKDLRKHGANYANAGQIDKEAYKNARVYDKKDGVDDRPDVWLSKLGYMDVDESTPETLAEAYDKIQRALDGEKVYRLEDQTAAESRAAYEERLQTILQIFPDVKTAQEALKSIAQLEEMGYRAVEKRDIASFERLLAELENLVTTKQDTKEGENAFKAADRLRREVINEIQKRSLAEKQIMLDWLNKAKTTEEIREATGNVLEFLEKQYAKTDEAKAEAEMLAIPKTNYGALKIKILKSINDINEQAAQEVKAAQARLAEFARAETRGLTLNSEELNERARLRGVLEKQLNEPYRRAILAALAGIRHLPAADKGKFMRTFMGARAANFLPQEIDDILRRAKEIEETNYKKHLDKRIRAVLAQNLFDKTGSLKRALLDAQTMNAIGQLKDVLKKSPEEAAQELQERINISMANPGAVSPTDKIVNELLSIVANGAKESSMELYKQTFDDITALRKAGRSAMNLQKMVRDFRTETDKQEVLTALKKNKEHGLLKRLFLGHIGNWESFLDLSTSKEIKEKYSMLQEESDCIAYTWTRRRSIEKAAKRVYRLNSHAELGNKINELLKETDTFMNYALVDNNPDPAAIRKVGEVFPEKLHKMQLINAYIYCKNDILHDRLIKQYGKEQLQDMLFNRLSAQDRAFGDLLQKEAEDSYQMINRVFVRERGYDLPKTQAYFPSRVTRVESDIDLLKAAAEMSKNPSFTKFRSGSAAIQMELGNPLDILFSHIEKAAEYAYKSEKINRIRRVFMSSQLKPWFEKVLTKDGYNVFVNMIENISTDKTKAQHDIDKLGDWLTNNYVRGAIALKPTIAIKQLISAMNYAENMPSTQWAAGFVKAVAHPKETVQFMLDADPYLRTRYESGSMNEAMEKMMAAAEAFGKAQKVMSLTNLLSISTRLGDIGAIVFGGKPYVDYLMSQKGMSKEEAIKECRKSTLRSQQFNGKSSLSRHQINGKNGGYIVRALLAFRNTPAQYARKIAEAIAEFQRGEITAAQLGKTVAIYALFNNWVYSLVTSLSVLAKLLGKDDEADEMLFNDFILSPFTQMASALPILSEASNFAAAAVSSKVFDHKVNLNNVGRMPVLSDLVNLGAKAIKENKSAEDVLNMFFTSVQYGLGLPAHYLGALPGAAKDMAGENPMRGFLKALGYTKYRAGKITGEEE